eukprot:NODE_9576_length_1413_cov_8.981337.p2 GENE.NODE_9576_length_1413_cov_8.981337~~NODE_9576_length_1413_cov_8.981337.p2  ORF type:complete len:155 (+),score=31.99 NODE_9576_length_1413_cov_8.981337:47-511(+)
MEGCLCRVCSRGGLATEVLISPCIRCEGPSSYVHYSCLAGAYIKDAAFLNLRCPFCGDRYEPTTVVGLGSLGVHQLEAIHGRLPTEVALMHYHLSLAYGELGEEEMRAEAVLLAHAVLNLPPSIPRHSVCKFETSSVRDAEEVPDARNLEDISL